MAWLAQADMQPASALTQGVEGAVTQVRIATRSTSDRDIRDRLSQPEVGIGGGTGRPSEHGDEAGGHSAYRIRLDPEPDGAGNSDGCQSSRQ